MISFFKKTGLAVFLMVSVAPAFAQIIVSDPTGYAQQLKEVANEVQEIGLMEQQIDNQIRMLTTLPTNMLNLFTSQIQLMQNTVTQMENLRLQGATLTAYLQSTYPPGGTVMPPQQAMQQLLTINTAMRTMNQQSLTVQQMADQQQPLIQNQIQQLVSASQGASGTTGAVQATNQILAALSQQVALLTTTMSNFVKVYNEKMMADAATNNASQNINAVMQSPVNLNSLSSLKDIE